MNPKVQDQVNITESIVGMWSPRGLGQGSINAKVTAAIKETEICSKCHMINCECGSDSSSKDSKDTKGKGKELLLDDPDTDVDMDDDDEDEKKVKGKDVKEETLESEEYLTCDNGIDLHESLTRLDGVRG